jgi:CubicO group peptidase (beta-lactamase class C family)
VFDAARDLLRSGVIARAYPAASIEVGSVSGPRWQEAFGRLTYEPDAPACRIDTIFDLASLTKVIATTPLVMQHVAAGRVALSTRVADLLPAWRGGDKERVTIRHLLDHSSGLPAHARLWESAAGRAAYEAAICAMPLNRAPGTSAVYSDPGFVLLGFVVEDLGGLQIAQQFDALVRCHIKGDLIFMPAAGLRDRIAPTEWDRWRGRVLCGEVHDENAAALGGAAGHAGLFGTVTAVGDLARAVLRTFNTRTWLADPMLMRTFATRSDVPGSSRALGWDTMLPTSSCGTLMSSSAIGHTGFTGTSLWIDVSRDLYVALLTNRVHPTRGNNALIALRPKIHDAIVSEMEVRRT